MKKEIALIEKYGSPLYVYDYEILKDRCNKMKFFQENLQSKLLKNIKVSMHYSTKANSNLEILKIVKECGLNVDCMSPLEMILNEKSGFSKERMLYVCNNISEEEMRIVHEHGYLICLDSISQVETWGKIFPNTNIMIRINPETSGVGHSEKVMTAGKATKFGISESNFSELFKIIEKYHLRIIGTHQHLGSLFLNDKVPEYILGIKESLILIKKYFQDVEIVDLGGGFGVPYTPEEKELDLTYVVDQLTPILNEFIENASSLKEIKFEPGRYIPCEAGKILGKVIAIKHENNTWWIGTDIGMNQLIRPAMYGSYHEVSLINQDSSKIGPEVTANFCGNVCESGDILAKNRQIHLPQIGDIIVVHNAGAYGFSMASNYTGRLKPAEIMCYPDGKDVLIRKKETMDSILEQMIF